MQIESTTSSALTLVSVRGQRPFVSGTTLRRMSFPALQQRAIYLVPLLPLLSSAMSESQALQKQPTAFWFGVMVVKKGR